MNSIDKKHLKNKTDKAAKIYDTQTFKDVCKVYESAKGMLVSLTAAVIRMCWGCDSAVGSVVPETVSCLCLRLCPACVCAEGELGGKRPL